ATDLQNRNPLPTILRKAAPAPTWAGPVLAEVPSSMKRGRYILSVVVAGVSLFLGPSHPGALAARGARPDTERLASESTPEELRFVELANKERVSRGLKPLTIDPMLI